MLILTSASSFANIKPPISPIITPHVSEEAKKNINWKAAFLTEKKGQVVFMNISPDTCPSNEIGMETHKYDQVIFVVEGAGKAILNKETSSIASGDMILIPQGTPHNVINLSTKNPLKLISICSGIEIPPHAVYKKKADEPVGLARVLLR